MKFHLSYELEEVEKLEVPRSCAFCLGSGILISFFSCTNKQGEDELEHFLFFSVEGPKKP